MTDIKRTAEAVWDGDLRRGNGRISSNSGVLKGTPYSFGTRFEDEPGTNPTVFSRTHAFIHEGMRYSCHTAIAGLRLPLCGWSLIGHTQTPGSFIWSNDPAVPDGGGLKRGTLTTSAAVFDAETPCGSGWTDVRSLGDR